MLQSSKFFLDKVKNLQPEVAIILGSGLTNFFDEKNIKYEISRKTQKNDFGKCLR